VLIAIDGPAGAGKSTLARALAEELGFTYLDSGAMYRCVGLVALERDRTLLHGAAGVPAPDLGPLAESLTIEFAAEGAGKSGPVLLDGRNVSAAIRSREVAEAASVAAADPTVRAALVAKQRELIATGDWVAEGRDIGTVVAPEAELKVFLTADPRERARRRAVELGANPETVLAEQAMRDERDSTREHSPLRPAPGAVELDTSELSVEQLVAQIAALARRAPGRS
jgi:cytidylate kinase